MHKHMLNVKIKSHIGTREITQNIKVFSFKPGDLRLIPRIQTADENRLLQAICWSSHMLCGMYTFINVHTYKINKHNKKFKTYWESTTFYGFPEPDLACPNKETTQCACRPDLQMLSTEVYLQHEPALTYTHSVLPSEAPNLTFPLQASACYFPFLQNKTALLRALQMVLRFLLARADGIWS